MGSQDDGWKQRLDEAEATLEAIRGGRVDALVVDGGGAGEQVYTLESADLPYRQFLEQMAEGAVSLDADSTVLYCNRFFADLLELPRERILGSSFVELIQSGELAAYHAALQADAPQRLGLVLQLPSGVKTPVQLAVTPIGAGPARRYTVVITDLSERERLAELSAAREAVEAESLAKDRFLAALGHELRGPLNVIMGWTAFLLEQREQFERPVQRALEALDRNARLQRRLIEDMVDVARISSGKLRLDPVPLDVSELARATALAVQLAAQEKRLDLVVSASGKLQVMGDAHRLEQMLQNLLGNAIKFTPAGGRIELAVDEESDQARISVADTGRGIDPALLEQIFQPFRQGQSDLAGSRGTGLGLGLAITKQIVELHGGEISARSEGAGRGTTFVVTLPLANLHETQERPSLLPEAALSGVRVLVVDDEEEVRELTARVLSRSGAEVVCASGAESALARIEGQSFDVIVSDLMMPGTDGWELARKVRERHGTALPMLALSGVAGAGQGGRAAASGFRVLLRKPLQEDELIRYVRTLAKETAD